MSAEAQPEVNVQQAVPFFNVKDMQAALRFYVDGLGFQMKLKWLDEGVLRWCWLELGKAALMLQEFRPEFAPEVKLGEGVSVCFMCRDALAIYREAKARGLDPRRPFVGNRLWVTSFTDTDGYHVDFESPTDEPEETVYTEP
jgi:lactoylglutathione lyase